MKAIVPMLLLVWLLAMPVEAMEFTAPTVPEAGVELMPEHTGSFAEALAELWGRAVQKIRPDLKEAAGICIRVVCVSLLLHLLAAFRPEVSAPVELTAALGTAGILLSGTNSMILLAKETVMELSSYGKLLLPVMTGALAAQGGITASTGLYMGTAFFDTLLGEWISGLFLPAVSLYLALAVAGSACHEDILKKIRDMVKNTLSWTLKTLLTVFTTYMSITGVVSGTTDAAALKATKVTISTVVPVVGGILSDASEAVLVGAGVMKNAAGIYGILAILAVFLDPFLRIGMHYLLLKATAAICAIFAGKGMTALVEDFSSAMGMLLALTGAMCLLLLISTVCFLKGVA